MKNKFTKLIGLIITIVLISGISNLNAQINLKQVKDKAVDKGSGVIKNSGNNDGQSKIERDKQNQTDAEHGGCGYMINGTYILDEFENHWKIAMESIDLKEYTYANSRIEKLDYAIEQLKINCPNIDAKPYEKRMAELKPKIAQLLAEANVAAESSESDQKVLSNANFILSYITDYRLELGNYPVSSAQSFYDKCKESDYLNYKKNLEAIMARNPEVKAQAEKEPYGGYVKLNKDYAEFLETSSKRYIPVINRLIEEVYADKAAKRMNDARDKAQACIICADGLLLIAPDNVDFKAIKKDAKAAFDVVNKELALTVYTSLYHGENVRKFVFSKKPIVLKSENPANMTNTFVAGDYIYSMSYLADKVNTLAYNSDVRLEIYVDGAQKFTREFSLYNKKDLTAFDFEIVPDSATSAQQGGVEYARELATLSPRNHKIKIILNNRGAEILAEGEFTIDCTQGMDQLTSIAQTLRNKELSSVVLPAGGALNTATLQQQTMKIWLGDETPLRAVVTSDNWETHYNDYSGAIEYRDAWTAIAVKRTDGSCAIFYMAIRQDYTGSGYGVTKYGAMGDSEDIPCENVSK